MIFHAVDSYIWTQWVKLLRIFLGILAQAKQAQMGAIYCLARVGTRDVISGPNLIEFVGWRIDDQREE